MYVGSWNTFLQSHCGHFSQMISPSQIIFQHLFMYKHSSSTKPSFLFCIDIFFCFKSKKNSTKSTYNLWYDCYKAQTIDLIKYSNQVKEESHTKLMKSLNGRRVPGSRVQLTKNVVSWKTWMNGRSISRLNKLQIERRWLELITEADWMEGAAKCRREPARWFPSLKLQTKYSNWTLLCIL